MDDQDRTEEGVVEIMVLEVLADGKIKSNGDIKHALRKSPIWKSGDLERSNKRQDEPKWYTSVNNVLKDDRGLYASECVERYGRGQHKITTTGQQRLAQLETMRSAIRTALPDDVAQELINTLQQARNP